MLMQNFGVTNKEHYGMLLYFLEWSIVISYAAFFVCSHNAPTQDASLSVGWGGPLRNKNYCDGD